MSAGCTFGQSAVRWRVAESTLGSLWICFWSFWRIFSFFFYTQSVQDSTDKNLNVFKSICLQTWSALTVCTQRGGSAHALFALCDTEGTYAWWTRSAIPEPLAPVPLNPWCSRTCWGRRRMDRTIHRPGRGGRYKELSSFIPSLLMLCWPSVNISINEFFRSHSHVSQSSLSLFLHVWCSFYWWFQLNWH